MSIDKAIIPQRNKDVTIWTTVFWQNLGYFSIKKPMGKHRLNLLKGCKSYFPRISFAEAARPAKL